MLSGVLFYTHMKNQAPFPNADEGVEEPGRIAAERSAGRHTEEIITFAVYSLLVNSAR